jgi:hypothetical protein
VICRFRGGEIDAPIGEVTPDRCGIAIGGRAVAASARSDDFDRLSGTQSAGSVDEGLRSIAKAEGLSRL